MKNKKTELKKLKKRKSELEKEMVCVGQYHFKNDDILIHLHKKWKYINDKIKEIE